MKSEDGKPSVSLLRGERDHAKADFDKFSITPQTSQLKFLRFSFKYIDSGCVNESEEVY